MINKACVLSALAATMVGAVNVKQKAKCPFGYTSSGKTDEDEALA